MPHASVADDLAKPVLTLPAAEAAALRDAYAGAGVILEYGSGGSTLVAADLPGKTIFSVESDADWARMMESWFQRHPPRSAVTVHHANIGRTRQWGMPKDNGAFRRWPGYALSVWNRPDFQHPDVVLVDGRFRAACLLTTLFRITRPVTLLFDDYAERPHYHTVEKLVQPAQMHGRMAVFALAPMPLPIDKLDWIMRLFLSPL